MSDRPVDLDTLAAREEERAFLLRSLEDLEREYAAGDLDDDDYRTLKDDYTRRAAELLRAIEAGRAALPAPRPRNRWRTVAVAATVLALAVGAGVVVSRSSGERLTTDTATGDIRDSSVRLLQQGQDLFAQGRLLDAIKTFDEVLAVDPDNPEALAYRGWALYQAGSAGQNAELLTAAERNVDQAIAASPQYAPARVFKAVILARVHDDPAGAFEQVNLALAAEPPPPGDLRALAEAFRAQLAERLGTTPAPEG